MNTEEKFLTAFRKYIPAEAVAYCFDLWKQKPFTFHITKERVTKLGDFRYHTKRGIQTITINHNLNPYQFLITFLHEVAHLHTFDTYGAASKPHGMEWKVKFQELMLPMYQAKVFPPEIMAPLGKYMQNPKASTGSDHKLAKVLRSYDKDKDDTLIFLMDIAPEMEFTLQKRHFIKKETRRTRIVCEEISTGRRFLISGRAEVVLRKKNQ